MFVCLENPPLDKKLRKRKREEEKEDANVNFFTRRPETSGKIELLKDDAEEDLGLLDKDDSTSSDEMLPSTKFRRGGDLPSDLDMGSDIGSDGSDDPKDDDDGDWNMMGAALEREFLGLDQ